ncbi:MAG TPA: hypothetical protein VNG31_02320 [Candidatus Baltobacteraceae bacterium]|nr:hypothetical protein [Candidatus Baltobacteraceae bacterium]
MELRPLGFGEIFDRAITLYIRNFIPFAGIVSVLVVPLAVVQYFLDQNTLPQLAAAMEVLKHPSKTPPPPPNYFSSPLEGALLGLLVLTVWIAWPFAVNACAVGIARLYRGRPVEFAACYRATLSRWLSVLGLLLIEAGIAIVWYVLSVMVFALAIVVTVLLARVALPLAVIVGMMSALFLVANLLAIGPVFVAFTFAMNAVIIEERPAFAATVLGFRRVFNRQEFWRALLFAIAAGAVMMGASTLIGVLSLLALFAHLIVLEVVLTSLFRAAIAPFSIVLLAVYYFDVRIRREGYEIEAGLDRLANAERVA